MATNQEVLQHITGHTGGTPLQLTWQNFTPVQQPRIRGRDAFTDAPFNINVGFPAHPDQDGSYRFQNVRITVTMSRASSWVVNGKQSPALLDHEQGHYNITWLVMRELCRDLLDVEWDATVLAATSGTSHGQVQARLRQDYDRLTRTARSDVDRLNTQYDSVPEANHGLNAGGQSRWDRFFQYVIRNQESDLSSLLLFGAGTPSGF
jgi:hypothetical protein